MKKIQMQECVAEFNELVAEVCCISLKDATERREVAQQQLNSTSFKWCFIEAVNGKQPAFVSPEYDKRKRICVYGYDMTPGEIGCFLSHRKAWQLCVDRGRPMLVLEDDFVFLKSAEELYALVGELSVQFHYKLIRLAAIFPKEMVELASVQQFTVVRYQGDPSGAAAYLIHPDAAQKLLKNSNRFYMPVDDYMNQEYLHGVAFLGIVPYPIMTRDIPSTIEGRASPRLGLLKKLRRECYRIPDGFARWLYRIRKA